MSPRRPESNSGWRSSTSPRSGSKGRAGPHRSACGSPETAAPVLVIVSNGSYTVVLTSLVRVISVAVPSEQGEGSALAANLALARGDGDGWDASGHHNPAVRRVGDRYALAYNIADRKNMINVGTHLVINFNKALLVYSNTGFLCID